MNKLIKVGLIGLVAIGLVVGGFIYKANKSVELGAQGAGWKTSSATAGVISPTAINGTDQAISVVASATSTIANLGGVYNVSAFSGTDMGDKINTVYALCPLKSCILDVPRGVHPYDTMIDFGTDGKRALLRGTPGGGTELVYTGTGTSTLINWGDQDTGVDHTSGCGISDITFTNTESGTSRATSSTAIKGIVVGGSNGTDCTVFNNVNIQGFGYGLYLYKNNYHFAWYNGVLRNNGQNLRVLAADNSGENLNFYNPLIADGWATYGEEADNCIVFEDSATENTSFHGGQINNCQINAGQVNNIYEYGTSHENSGSTATNWGAYTPIVVGNNLTGHYAIYGSSFFNTADAGYSFPTMISCGGNCVLDGVIARSFNGETITRFATLTGSGQVTWSGFNNGSFSGTRAVANVVNNSLVPVNGSTASTSLMNFGGRLDASQFSGSEVGAQWTAAYAAHPVTGGATFYPKGSWTQTTGASFGTDNKTHALVCDSSGGASNNAIGGTTITYTSTTGTSTSWNTNDYVTGMASGLYNCNLQGTNGTTARITTGVYMGGSNGAFGGRIEGSQISGFGEAIAWNSNTSFMNINQSAISFNGRNINYPDSSGANCERLSVTNSTIADSNNAAGGVSDLKGWYMQESGNCQWEILNTSIDDNQIFIDQFGGTSNIWNFIASHFENPNLHEYSMIEGIATASNVVVNLIGTDMMNDTTSGQPDQIKGGFEMVNLIGFTSDANSDVTVPVTRIVSALSSTTVVTWNGLACQGANTTSFVYGRVPCSPFGVGSDYGQPSLYVASTTSKGIGIVGIATSTTNMDMASSSVLNIGVNPGTNNASSTINMKRLQFQGESASGVVSCAYVVGTAWVVESAPCKN